MRLLLLKDLEAEMEKAATQPVSKADLLHIFENKANLYANITTGRMLSDKMSDEATKAQVEKWFGMIDSMSRTATPGYVTADGQDLKQLTAKTIMGSVFYYRAMNDYLSPAKLTAADNNTVTEGEGTKMEHYFDEGFGYFGAARTYNNLTDDQIAGAQTGTDPKSDVNFYYAQTAAKRDKEYNKFTSQPTNFTKDLFDQFLKGRHAVTQKDYATRDAAVSSIRASWDKMIAATVIHYGKEVLADKAKTNPTDADMKNMAKHWSEMVGYFGMIRHNTDNKLGVSKMLTIGSKLGTNAYGASVSDIESAIQELKAAYNL